MGDTEDQEVQEGPVENAWALKVKNLLINYYLRYLKHNETKGACQKKNTGFFGSFSQMSDPPTSPIWEASVQKKIGSFRL